MVINVLLLEDNPGDARLVKELLREAGASEDHVLRHVERLQDALAALDEQVFDVMLLDLSVPDAQGLDTVAAVQAAAPAMPIVVLSGDKDDALALQAVQSGAQDYLVKGQGDGRILARALRYAIERKRSEERLSFLAQYDALTGLPNRVLLKDRLSKALDQARRHQYMVAVLYLDLDRFKEINDTRGHDAGDKLLECVAGRLERCVRRQDTVSRLAGDEFVVLLTELEEAADAERVAAAIVSAIAEPYSIDAGPLLTGASVGIAVYPNSGVDPDVLLKNADTALYEVKAGGGNGYRFHRPDVRHTAGEGRSNVEMLREAHASGQFRVYYQPRLDPRSGRVVAFEALLRWDHPENGLIPASRFIRSLEESGLLARVGDWVLRTACADAVAWARTGAPQVKVAVNLAPTQFRHRDLVAGIERVLQETGLDAQRLQLEVAEEVMGRDLTQTIATVDALLELGVRVSLDHFGRESCSLSSLQGLALESLNLDPSFVRGLTEDPRGARVAKAVVDLGHGLDFHVTAAGVETRRELDLLHRTGCDAVQGYFIGEPMAAEACAQWSRALDGATHMERR